MADSFGSQLLASWARLSRVPGGRRLFSWMVGRQAPYTGTIGARIVEFRPGYVRATLRDRRAVRNHLNSIHAVALVNFAEVVSGVAMLSALPAGLRGIVTGLSIEYLKKARGTLTGESTVTLPQIDGSAPLDLQATIRDAAGDEVARATVHWVVGPVPDSAPAPPSAEEAAGG